MDWRAPAPELQTATPSFLGFFVPLLFNPLWMLVAWRFARCFRASASPRLSQYSAKNQSGRRREDGRSNHFCNKFSQLLSYWVYE
jgi:hypothetical protein